MQKFGLKLPKIIQYVVIFDISVWINNILKKSCLISADKYYE